MRTDKDRRSSAFLQGDSIVWAFLTCAGIALYPGNAQLLGCSHYYRNDIPPMVDPGKPQDIDCEVMEVTYVGPYSSREEVSLFFRKNQKKNQRKSENSADWLVVS